MNIYDIVIIGSGLGGSACAAVLGKLGYRVALIERGEHPRFAIGESATPVMSKKIRHLGELYDIKEFKELSTYDHIKEAGIEIDCGPKELFHYFIHDKGQESVFFNDEVREFIVQTPEVDAQYYRADSDALMVQVAKKYGVEYMDRTAVKDIDFSDKNVKICCENGNGDFEIDCQFVIDATGFRSIIGEKYGLKIQGDELGVPLKSRSIFAHFSGVNDFEEMLKSNEGFVDRSPASRSRATQHHCFDGGWLWVIPFENGKVSIGLNLDLDVFPLNDLSAEEEFWMVVKQYPVINNLLSGHQNIMPFVKTGRMQFVNKEMVGDRWAMLPASAYGLDAWFSTGLASSFIAIHRLAEILNTRVFPRKNFKRSCLLDYEVAMKKEYVHVAKMIHGMYKSFKHFDIFKHYCALCFMGAESFISKGGIEASMNTDLLLLNAGDAKFTTLFSKLYEEVKRLSTHEKVDYDDVEKLSKFLQEDMAEFNFRNFGSPSMYGMHPRVEMA